MKKIINILLLTLCVHPSWAQFSANGSIEFTKVTSVKMNIQVEMGEEIEKNEYMKDYVKQLPKTKSVFYKMSFNKKQSHYFFDKDGPEKVPLWGGKDPASENIVVKNFSNNTITAQKEVYESNYIIQDSLPKYKWKILDEMRPIAGYNCRKAITTMDDSVVVVAYYTEQIMVSSGPESFGGLPGMILGLAIPRLYTTWFASKVNPGIEMGENEIKKIKKGKELSNEKLFKELQPKLKEWGKYGAAILWKIRV
ncbi:GLPGLI family protein [Taibaiella sp. KBW10]|uniref:GLPGLI family protein n=1 Tax=Taibaiella sp. KBW10 TaxID=2153357 RepID=UPI000F59CA05|nr:GLPGLI family protein [Taibaiella sp. KBW10]RQO30341.1 GLPGLI family protein [Taibaiella sp. KBW10]